MTHVEDRLRAVLRDLPPEPPAELGLPSGALRRARALHRRRIAATTVVSLVAVVAATASVAKLTEAARGRDVGWAAPPGAELVPNWPRRGDVADPAVDRQAVAAWDARLRVAGVNRVGTPRVLFAGGEPLVVVLHGVAERGGERLVVLTRGAGGFEVFADRPSPSPHTPGLAIVVGGKPLSRPDLESQRCRALPLGAPRPRVQVLALGGPGTRSARWRPAPFLHSDCTNRADVTGPWQDIPLRDGAGIVAGGIGPLEGADVQVVGGRVPDWRTPHVWAETGTGSYRPVEVAGPPPKVSDRAVLEWSTRMDGSRAWELGDDLAQRVPHGICPPSWAASAPDGTPVWLCAAVAPDWRTTAVLGAEGPDRRVRLYLEIKLDPVPTAFAAVVDGLRGRWLVVVGPPELAKVTLVDGARRTDVPLHAGSGFLRLDEEPGDGAYLTTPDYPPDGGFAIQDRTGSLLAGE